jgi:hypothetical protein
MSEDPGSAKPPLGNIPRRDRVLGWVSPPNLEPRLVWVAAACAAGGVLLVVTVGSAVRGCRASGRLDLLEQRVAHVETALGMSDGGMMLSADTAPLQIDAGAIATADSPPECAVAKVAAYQAWQDAFARAKVLAAPAQAACAGRWGDEKKQACYHAASAGPRSAQAARDSVIAGGSAARDAVKSVKDDAKNESIAPARAASEHAFAACGEGSLE